jgi:hypothetical protein
MPMPAPMKLMIAAEFASSGAEEISLFQRLSDGNGTNPFRLALCPRLIPLQLEGGGGGAPFPPLIDVTCNVCDVDVALPGLGFITATEKAPADARFAVAVSCVKETYVVVSGEPARRTCAPLTNPLPFTVIAIDPAGTAVGAMPASIGTGFCNVIELVAVAVESAALTARTVTRLFPESAVGAVKIPAELMVPVETAPPLTPFTCQVTELFEDPETVALNDFVAPTRTVAVDGETATLMPEVDGGVLEFPDVELDPAEPLVAPVHPASVTRTAIATTSGHKSRELNVLNFAISKHTRSLSINPGWAVVTMPGCRRPNYCTEGQDRDRSLTVCSKHRF